MPGEGGILGLLENPVKVMQSLFRKTEYHTHNLASSSSPLPLELNSTQEFP